MDMFMDKLAQKLTAQEIIKANTAADIEELNKLKNQVGEYNECLARLQKMIDDASLKLTGAQAHSDEVDGLLREILEGVQALGRNLEDIGKEQENLAQRIADADKSTAWQMELVSKNMGEKLDNLAVQMEEQVAGKLAERFEAVEDSVHKECVRVYRNVQAVVAEEGEKQSAASAQAGTSKKKTSAILGVAVTAMVLSLAGVVLQVLNMLNVF